MAALRSFLQTAIKSNKGSSIINMARFMTSASQPKHSQTQFGGTYTNFEESRTEWHYVERLIPRETVPTPPKHEFYPTPSGWQPPAEKSQKLPYYVDRTRFHQLPVYFLEMDGGSRQITEVRRVGGDIWALEMDIKTYLENRIGGVIATQVHEVASTLRIKGIYLKEVAKFLMDKGF